MVLINISSLNDCELRYIVSSENVDGWQSMNRQQLIECLNDIYGEDAMASEGELTSGNRRLKFCKGLTDVQSDGTFRLPGVEKLPPVYMETAIRILPKDINWAYIFWSLGPNEEEKLNEIDPEFSLYLEAYELDDDLSVRESFKIDIDLEDSSWNFSLPDLGCKYRVSLFAKTKDQDILLAESNIITVPRSVLLDHIDEIKNDPDRICLLFSSILNKDRAPIGNRLVDMAIKKLNKQEFV
ncbi:MAG: DUF4912 domain-containing protein [Sphaerochaetaceae bacterium]|jgi:hypothetical protein|nr:DUF4912 domain-containing protein [Sphaerochaetaceae bacterium]